MFKVTKKRFDFSSPSPGIQEGAGNLTDRHIQVHNDDIETQQQIYCIVCTINVSSSDNILVRISLIFQNRREIGAYARNIARLDFRESTEMNV